MIEEPSLRSVELLHRARHAGYTGGKSAIYALAQTLRTRGDTAGPIRRPPAEFSQHDFGEVRVRYQHGTGPAATLIDDLSAAFRDGQLAQALQTYTHPAVLVVDGRVSHVRHGRREHAFSRGE
jgi:hypothetical protein